jgi:1,4-dihydroxy-2-naphthoate octaprenyltransferase
MDKDKDFHDLEKRKRNPFLSDKHNKTAIVLMVLSGTFLVLVGFYHLQKLYLNVLLFLVAFNYNAGIRAKNKPFLDVVVHGAWIVGMVVYGILFFNVTMTIRETTLLFQILVISTMIELSQGIRDYEVDKISKENTTVVYVGPKNTKVIYAILVIVFALVTPILVENVYLKYLSLLFLPFYFFARQETYDQRANVINSSYMLSVLIFFL